MNDYTTAPATKMLATHCACCSRPLVDANSVEVGVGPDCRKRHGYDTPDTAADWTAAQHTLGLLPGAASLLPLPAGWGVDARQAANVLVHRVAVEQRGANVTTYVNAIRALGFTKLAARIAERVASVELALENDTYVLRGPCPDEVGLAALRNVVGRRWNPEQRANTFPLSARRSLFDALRVAYAGRTVAGPKGLFTLAA